MRLKFKQGGTDAVIAVTNVHYCNRLIFPFLDKVQIRNIIYKKSIIKKGEKCTWIT